MSDKSILLLNGPNLNLLGRREPSIYGDQCLADIVERLASICQQSGVDLQHLQSNAEHTLVDRIQQCLTHPVDFIIINPAAFTHTSVAIRDALAAVEVPFVEVHLSNIYRREAFRKQSYFSDLACAVISGMGAFGYEAALSYALKELKESAVSN